MAQPPMPPQAAQPGAGAPQDPAQGQDPAAQGSGVSDLINNIGQGLAKLKALVQKAQSVPDEEKQMIDQIYQAYSEFVNNLSGKDSPQEEQQDQQEPQGGPGLVPPETGGRPSQQAM